MTASEQRLEIAIAAIDALEQRCADLEDRLSTIQNAWDLLRPCDECGIVFASPEDYAEHVCPGRQGT